MSVVSKKKINCSGCNACAEICPKHCVHMEENDKGFFYPKVDTTICNDCGLCMKICPLKKENVVLNAPLKAFAAWNKNHEEYLASSSGGAAYVFSSHIISLGGVVYGCTSDKMQIHHIRVSCQEELYKLQGSKYVQSDVRGIFAQVKKDLKAGLPVLFIGTPCQVAGLRNHIRNIPEHLYLVDLICHGVPSQKMLHEHIGRIAKGRVIDHISFRKGNIYCMEVLSSSIQNGSKKKWVYTSEPHKDMYFHAFLQGVTYRESCYHCPFACSKRVGDITIGDFWGLQNDGEYPENGVSVLLPSTDKGMRLIKAVDGKLVLKERDVDEAIKGNDQLRYPVKQTYAKKMFDKLYPSLHFDLSVYIAVVVRKLKLKLRL